MYTVADLLLLSQAPNIGAGRLRLLVGHFSDPADLFNAGVRDIAAIDGFHRKLSTDVVAFLRGRGLDDAKGCVEQQLSKINHLGGHIITYWDKQFPDLLRKIFDPPALLYAIGDLAPSDAFAIAIVGTRNPSSYGIAAAEKFAHEIASHGITVISGLARGIDTIAHDSALKAGGRTIAVIGSGLDKIYPPENRNLSERILESGAVLSEFSMGAKPDAPNFPRRNRIVSGLSLGTLIVETDLNGGAMITASLALDQNREVFAVPGPINARKSRGCNLLIKTGRAKLVDSFDDVAAELAVKLKPVLQSGSREQQAHAQQLSLFEQALYDLVADEPVHIDALSERGCMSTSDALVTLLNLEFKGLVKQLPGKLFIKM